MRVHRGRARQELVEPLGPDRDHQRQPDRPPDGIAPADPVLEPEHAVGVDPELRGLAQCRRERGELAGGVRHRPPHPVARGRGVGHRLDGGEGLGPHDHQRPSGIQVLQRVVRVGPIHVRDEMHARPVVIGRKRAHRHRGAKVGPADPDVHHVRVAAALPRDLAVADAFGKAAHPGQRVGDARQHVAAIHHDRRRVLGHDRPQRGVKDGAAFGFVDALAREHRLAPGRHVVREVQQQLNGAVVQRGLGPVQHHAAGICRTLCGAIRLGRKQGGDRAVGVSLPVGVKVVPGRHRGVPVIRPNARSDRPRGPARAPAQGAAWPRVPAPRAWPRRRSSDAGPSRFSAPGR